MQTSIETAVECRQKTERMAAGGGIEWEITLGAVGGPVCAVHMSASKDVADAFTVGARYNVFIVPVEA